MELTGLRLAVVGPLAPPAGGMANQTRQLAELLADEGAAVTTLQVNAPYRPQWIREVPVVRALCRLVGYAIRLWRVTRSVQLMHVMANSGWSWHLFAAPAIWIGSARKVPVVVNYRGGEAAAFLDRSGVLVRATMRRAAAVAVPSRFLEAIFARHAISTQVVPNIINLSRFRPSPHRIESNGNVPHLVVTRNLEAIYDISTALRAFAIVRETAGAARMTVAGDGPAEGQLRALCVELGVADEVRFCGRLDPDAVAALYRSATVAVNPSRVDNMPNSILEAMASGVPVVSTRVGGIPYILEDGVTGLFVEPGDHRAMAAAVLRLSKDPDLERRLCAAALAEVRQYAWPAVRQRWIDVYASVLDASSPARKA